MKKLALLNLLLLPLASLADAKSSPEYVEVRGVTQQFADEAWQSCERGLRDVARRLVGIGYAHAGPSSLQLNNPR